MDFLERFQQYTKERNLLPIAAPTLLAVSGGVDSMVMLYLFRVAELPFAVAHCNFQLRAAASDADAEFVEKIAAEMGVPYFVKQFDTKQYAVENGVSTQMAARELRYSWFAEISEKHHYPCLATAHNLNDSVETTLFNFVRGTGLSGLTGIQSKTATALIRPLLFATKEEILAYAEANNIVWREDSSNDSDNYARNFIRHHVVPKMQKLNPNFLHTAERNLVRLQETKENLEFLTRQFLGIKDDLPGQDQAGFSIDKQKLEAFPAPRRVLRELLKPQGFTEDQARQLAENLQQVGFMLESSSGWQVLCDRTKLIINAPAYAEASAGKPIPNPQSPIPNPQSPDIQKDDLMVRLPDGSTLFFMETAPELPYPDGTQAILANPAQIIYPLTVRHWEEGDVFQPIGMDGQSQKLQDYFTNQKLSRNEKALVWLLINGDGAIIWVVGMRLDERFKILEGTSSGLKVSWA